MHILLAASVLITTSLGNITVKLDEKKAPVSVANFLKYVNDKHYDGTVFHRVIKNFMIQGGGMDPALHEIGATYPPIKNESGNGLKNVTGAIAMARTNDPDSATDQFYINTKDNAFLDRSPGYAVFGKVTRGMDVVRKIEAVKTQTKPNAEGLPMADVPSETVLIKSIRVVK
ncbi:MAG TPA: peptidylprolyl isomerase [Myxococcales bacterium]|nr:peptidylprolyl isomerase [Myxococcales bacterium]